LHVLISLSPFCYNSPELPVNLSLDEMMWIIVFQHKVSRTVKSMSSWIIYPFDLKALKQRHLKTLWIMSRLFRTLL